MEKKKYLWLKKTGMWIGALVLTLGISVYQKMSGPTYPLKLKTEISGSQYEMELIRTSSIGDSCIVGIPKSEVFDNAYLIYHMYPGDFADDTLFMNVNGDNWETCLPQQPPAGKLQYFVVLEKDGKEVYNNSDESAIIRFKGSVPLSILIPHVIAMFLSMLFAIVALLMAITNVGKYKRMSYLTFGALLIGGFIFGPIMQYYAFGEAWTGWPVGKDLTDNKTLIAALFWIIALVLNLKKDRKWLVILASIVMFVVFSIPHSLGGSEYNYEKGDVETGLKD